MARSSTYHHRLHRRHAASFRGRRHAAQFRRPPSRPRPCADALRRAATQAVWRLPRLLRRNRAVRRRSAPRRGRVPHAARSGDAHFHRVAENPAAAAQHRRTGAHRSPARLPDLRSERQLRAADRRRESRHAEDPLPGGREPSRPQERPLAPLHDFGPLEVHQLLPLRARVRRGAGAVRALDAWPRIRGPHHQGHRHTFEDSPCVSCGACSQACPTSAISRIVQVEVHRGDEKDAHRSAPTAASAAIWTWPRRATRCSPSRRRSMPR